MNTTVSSTEQLAISVHDDALYVKRHLEFTNGTIDLALNFTVPTGNLTIGQIDAASLRVVVEHLQLLLDRAEAASKLAPDPVPLPGSPIQPA